MSDPLRVALVCPRFAPRRGGVETHTGRLARELARLGLVVTVVTQDYRRVAATHEEHPDGYLIRRFRLPAGLPAHAAAPGLAAHVLTAAVRYDVLHAHDYHALPALAAAVAPRVPLVLSTHYRGAPRGRERLHRLYRPFGTLLLNRAAAVVCLSAAEADALHADLPRAAHRTLIIPPGLDPADAAAPLPVPGRVVLAVGRLDRSKRLDLLIDALPALPADVRLVLVGDGPAAEPLTELAAISPAADRIRFTGPIAAAELARWRATATVAAVSSEQATTALALTEALAAGLPVVASDLPVHREVAGLFTAAPAVTFVTDGPFAWARALRAALAAAPDQAPAAAASLSWAQRAERIADLYARVAGGAPTAVGAPALAGS